jgi:phage terminase small subunit
MPALRNLKWEEFALAYANDRNASRAALKAGYTPSHAGNAGFRLTKNAEIMARVQEIISERWRAHHMEGDEIIARLSRLARVDVRDVMSDEGALLDPNALTDQGAAAIAGIEVLEQWEGKGKNRRKVGQVAKVKLRDPTPALRMLAEMHKLLRQPGEGMDALAGAIADRMQARRTQRVVVADDPALPDRS